MKGLFDLQQVSTDRLRTTALIKGNIETHQRGFLKLNGRPQLRQGPRSVCLILGRSLPSISSL